jgi:hypothetical protein
MSQGIMVSAETCSACPVVASAEYHHAHASAGARARTHTHTHTRTHTHINIFAVGIVQTSPFQTILRDAL